MPGVYGTPTWERERPLTDLVDSWLRQEITHSLSAGEGAKRHTPENPAVSRGPFYAPLFLRQQTLSTPPLVQQLKAQCKAAWTIKVFPQLMRGAAIIDELLYLWNYETGRDPIMYQASSIITAVEVVRPKPGVFEPHVHHILVIATYSSVELVAIHVRDPHYESLSHQKLDDFQVTTGQTIITSIATFEARDSDSSPRIFCGANDGCVYELEYQQQEGWVTNRIRLTNMSIPAGDVPVLSSLVYKARESFSSFLGFGGIKDLQVDRARNYLYALDSKGYVSMWWLGPESETTLRQYQCKILAGGDRAKAVSLHPIHKGSQQRISDNEILCVLLEDGSRVVFSASISHEGRSRELHTRLHGGGNSDLSTCPVKVVMNLVQHTVHVGPLTSSVPLEQLGQVAQVEEACRSCVSQRVSLLIPKNHQQNPQLICTASIDMENTHGNVLSVVDLKPLVRQADTWRRGELPTTGINIFNVVEEEWAGCVLQSSSSDLISQVVRRPPRFLAVHSAGITVLTRLRPADILHISLLYPRDRSELRGQIPDDQMGKLDFTWLLETYGKVEVSVMLLTLICSDVQGTQAASPQCYPFGASAGPNEEIIAHALSARPSQDVVQRAQEQFSKMGYAGHAALFQYFVRVSQRLWNTPFNSTFWEHMWGKKLFGVFIAPLEGLYNFLSLLVPPITTELQHVWNPQTDMVASATPMGEQVLEHMVNNESFSDLYDLLTNQSNMNVKKPEPDVLKVIELLSRRGLLVVVQRTVEALKILQALEDLSVADRTQVVSNIRFMELSRVVNCTSSDDSDFTDALMGELLRLPHAVERVWGAWRHCKCFFDPAAVDFYEARKRVLSPHSAGNPSLVQQALAQLERPEVAPCLLRRQSGQARDSKFRLEIICEDLRSAKHYLGAMQLAMVSARYCDPEQRAEYWHASVAERDASPSVDSAPLTDLDSNHHYFNARRRAYQEIITTLSELCPAENPSGAGLDLTPAASAQRAAAVEWALGSAAGKYYDSSRRGVAKPVLTGDLFQSSDKLLHFHLYWWLISRADAEGVWPSRSDLARVRPHRNPQQQAVTGDSLHQFLAAGQFGFILKQPLHHWGPQIVEPWRNVWSGWHVGLLNDLADYCEARDEGMFACCVRLTLANASFALLQDQHSDFANLPNFLAARIDVLVKAEAAAGREQSPNARHLEQWLQSQKPSAVAGVQMEMLRELPLEAWDAGIARCEQLVLAAAQDKEELQNELLPASRLYEMLHDSYDEAVPHLAIKLLRIMGIERPELKYIFNSTSNVGPFTVQTYVSNLIERHVEQCRSHGVPAIQNCFTKLQDAAGIDQGIVHHTPPSFMPLQLVLSGLEEMAMLVLEIQEGGPVPTGNLCDPKTNPASVVPGIVAQALGWPNSRVLYDGYRLLWSNVERGQTKDMYKNFRGNQVENVKARRGVNARLTAILGQFTLQWLDNYEDLSYPQSDFSYQQLTREYPVFADDVEHMRIAAEGQPEIPENVRRLIEECKLRLQRFAKRVCFD